MNDDEFQQLVVDSKISYFFKKNTMIINLYKNLSRLKKCITHFAAGGYKNTYCMDLLKQMLLCF